MKTTFLEFEQPIADLEQKIDALRFVRDDSVFAEDGRVTLPQGPARHLYLEQTKGSAMHFQQHFPGDPTLDAWARDLTRQTTEQTCLN